MICTANLDSWDTSRPLSTVNDAAVEMVAGTEQAGGDRQANDINNWVFSLCKEFIA